MDRNDGLQGPIRDKLYIGILILYVLDKLPYEISKEALFELVMFDKGFSWFEYSDSLSSLVQSNQITERMNQFQITDNGRRNVGYVGSNLPFSVRSRADELASKTAEEMERARQIEIVTDKGGDSFSVSMKLSDGVGEVISLKVAVPDRKTAGKIAEHMKRDAESIYQHILSLLLTE